MSCQVRLLPSGTVLTAPEGETLRDILLGAGVGTDAPCGGNGTCGKCRVTVSQGGVTTEALSCRYRVTGDATVHLREEEAPPVEEPTRPARCGAGYGLSFDVGTTTVVGYLTDPAGGVLATHARANSQRRHGADVMSRLSYGARPGGAEALRDLIRADLDRVVGALCTQSGVTPGQISQVVLAGNTAMSYLLAGQYPVHLAAAPFRPEAEYPLSADAGSLGLQLSPETPCLLLPPIGGYVGGDTTAALLAAKMEGWDTPTLLVDIGTNCELVLGSRTAGFAACAAAAGPAFEGAHISCGMRAEPGAITQVEPVGDGFRVKTVDDAPAAGICGSGLIDAVAGLLRTGAVNHKGTIAGGTGRVLLCGPGDGAAADVFITQEDIRQLQLAKGAILAGIGRLCHGLGLRREEIGTVLLAGAFGAHLRPESILRTGLLPHLPAGRIRPLGNAAGLGAVLAQHPAAYRRAGALARQCRYVALSGDPLFERAYIQSLNFPRE